LKNKEVDLMIRMDHDYKKNIDDLGKIMIMDRRGNLIPLSSLATFQLKRGAPQIKRFDYKRSKTLTGDIVEGKMTSYKANKILKDAFEKLSHQYPEVSLVFGGQAESTKESIDSLKDALVLSLIGIFAIMVFIFNSFLRPFIIMTTIPLGLIGVAISFYFHGRPVSFLAMIGVIGLAGIIVNSGIVLISFIEDMRKEGEMKLHEILVKSSGMRLRAVLVTSLTTISGLFPTAYGVGGSDSMLVPMTLAMAWGLTSGTFLTLVWVPCAYAIFEDVGSFTSGLFFKKERM
jgi:multidrug efflux pump subunit AcrB